MRTLGRVCTCLVIFAVTAGACPALAGPQEEAAAEALFMQGRRLLEQGKYAEACPKLAESQRIDPAVGTLLYLGECYERNGQLASAWATFQSASAAARKADQANRVRIATERASQLFSRLPRVSISVSAPARVSGLEITRDGSAVGEAAWGEPVPVDPGDHIVLARAPGKRPWSKTVHAQTGSVTTVDIPTLEDLVPTPLAPHTPTTNASGEAPDLSARSATSAATAASQPTPQSLRQDNNFESASTSNLQRTFAYVGASLGVVGLAFGTAFAVVSANKENDSEAYCRPDNHSLCQQRGLDLLDEARTTATLANISLVAGGVALAAGAVLYLTAPARGGANVHAFSAPQARQQSEHRLIPFVRAHANGLELGGLF